MATQSKQTKKKEKNCGKKETTRKQPEVSEPPNKRSRCSGNCSKELEGPQKTYQRHLLNKSEKKDVMIHINVLNEQQVALVCLSRALQQLSVIRNSNLSEFCGNDVAIRTVTYQ